MKKTFLFTIIAEFRKGTYVSQVRSQSAMDALKKWTDEIDPKEIKHLDGKTIEMIRADIAENDYDTPSKIEGLRNVWFTMLLSKKGSFFINIVKTA
jgi:hypothetical protein